MRVNASYTLGDADEDMYFLMLLPERLRNFMREEMPSPLNSRQVYEAYIKEGETAVLRRMLRQLRGEAMRDFGPAHPQAQERYVPSPRKPTRTRI